MKTSFFYRPIKPEPVKPGQRFSSDTNWREMNGVFLICKTKTPFISLQLTTNKAFKRGSSFCSLTRFNLQNEDPIHFTSVDNEQSIYARVFVL